MKLSDLEKLNHHAYCLIGGDKMRVLLLSLLEKKHLVSALGNSDFIDRTYDTFTIDDARELKEQSGIKPIAEGIRKIFILTMNGITVEAQNAMLKLLEEPAEYSHFFIIIPSAHLLLLTVKSRLSFIQINNKEDEIGSNTNELVEVRKFLKSNTAKRLEYIKNLLDDIAKEKKNKQDAVNFLNNVEQAVYEDLGVKSGRRMLETIDIARKYANDRAPSLKMLLESVALVK
jgi:hypothetical protein